MPDIIDTATLFKFQNIPRDENLVFVLMPFQQKYFDLFEKIIKPAAMEKNLNCVKADDPKTNNAIIKDIIEHIHKSRFLIADITDRNSNVMYEIGVADAISREVILINDRLDKEKQDYPFDINYRRFLNYENTAAGGQDFRKVLGDTIDVVLVKTAESEKHPETQSIEVDKLNQLVWQTNLQYRLRARRIEWFTYHPIHFLSRFAKFHTEISNELKQLKGQFSSEKFEIIRKRSGHFVPSPEYIKNFILTELNDTKDLISNAWIVNKFPDELKIVGLGGTLTYLSTLNDIQFEYQYDSIIESIGFDLERLNFYISALQDERIEVGLPVIDLDKK